MKSGVCEICYARMCIPCSVDMETIYLVRRRGDAKRVNCERCGQECMTLKVQYTMKGAELIRRGIEPPPSWMEDKKWKNGDPS